LLFALGKNFDQFRRQIDEFVAGVTRLVDQLPESVTCHTKRWADNSRFQMRGLDRFNASELLNHLKRLPRAFKGSVALRRGRSGSRLRRRMDRRTKLC